MTWTIQAAVCRETDAAPLPDWQRRLGFRTEVTTENRQRIDRSFTSRSELTGRAFSLPVRFGRLFLWRLPFSLKSPDSQSGLQWTLFHEGIGNRVDLQEKSARLSADRCLNELSGQLRVVSSYFGNRCNTRFFRGVHPMTNAWLLRPVFKKLF